MNSSHNSSKSLEASLRSAAESRFDTLQSQFDDLRLLQEQTREERNRAREAYWELRSTLNIPAAATHADALAVVTKLMQQQASN